MIDLLMNTIRHLPAATILVDSTGIILQANPAADQLFGFANGDLKDKPLDLLIPKDRKEIHKKLLHEYAGSSLTPPKGTGLSRHGLRQDGTLFAADIAFSPVEHTGTVAFLATIRDISLIRQTELELRQANRSLRLLASVNQGIVRIHEEQKLLQETCRIAVEVGSYRMAWVGAAGQDEDKRINPVAFHGFNNGFIEKLDISWGNTGNYQTAMGEAIRSGTPIIRTNLFTNPQMAPCQADARQRGYQAVIALPLKIHKQVWGALALFAPETSAFGPHEYKILTELAEDLAFGIQAIRSAEVSK
jgi:PAS domain S-box-containing protein